MRRMIKFLFVAVVLTVLSVSFSCGGKVTPETGPDTPAQMQADHPAPVRFNSGSLVGYWQSRSDDLQVHITGLEYDSVGSGSFKDRDGRVYHAGKLRNIRYLGGNKWECQEWQHPMNLVYDPLKAQVGWRYALIEMIDFNTIRVGKTIYDRT